MNNDLISREALKKTIQECEKEPNYQHDNEVNCVLTMFGKCSYNKTGCSDCEIKDKIRKALSERPQGEWNYIQAGMAVCPFCGAIPHKDYKNFCAKCGANLTRKAVRNE